ncbi:MAG: TM0106 family RecB-like putative nuclease [Beutenbergiaceae bacterium]
MFVLDDAVVFSVSDLKTAMRCEFGLLHRLDVAMGLAEPAPAADPMRERVAHLNAEHAQRVLAEFQASYGTIATGEPISQWDRQGLVRQHEHTLATVRDHAPVLAGAGLFDGRCYGRADFLVSEADSSRYTVITATIARRAQPTAVLQAAAYADQLDRAGVALSAHIRLHLGTGKISSHPLRPALAVLREHRSRAERLLDIHAGSEQAQPWGDPQVQACGRCPACQAAMEQARDVRLVWGLRRSHQQALSRAGITTVDQLAAGDQPVPQVHPNILHRLRTQARMQVEAERSEAAGGRTISARVHSVAVLDRIPAPDQGDVFFDFEGDPMWTDADRSHWGLEYLFGLMEAPTSTSTGQYRAFWAHDRAGEKQALVDFLDYLRQRRAQHPNMHVYHYAFYEPATLRKLADRHRIGQQHVADLLDDGVFVDLYEIVKHGVHVSQRSYSIKKLEPLYMGDRLRDATGVTSGGDSVLAYSQACAQRDAGDQQAWLARLADLAEYNAYDCLSTLGLRDWLLQQRSAVHARQLDSALADAAAALGGRPVEPAQAVASDADSDMPAPGADSGAGAPAPAGLLDHDRPTPEHRRLAGELLARSDLASDPAAAAVAAALGYHDAEADTYWRAHYERLDALATLGAERRDVFQVHRAQPGAWQVSERGKLRRMLRVEGRLGAGSTIAEDATVFCVYDTPLPFGMRSPVAGGRAASYGTLKRRGSTPDGEDWLELWERPGPGVNEHAHVPVLVTAGPPPPAGPLIGALCDVAQSLLGQHPPSGRAGLALARRSRPSVVPRASDATDQAQAVLAAVLASDSYVAVQGPPGTGKTTLAARVISDLVRIHGWRVGIVAQSHAVVEQLLHRVIDAGVPPRQVGKRGCHHSTDPDWQVLNGYGPAAFLAAAGGSADASVPGGQGNEPSHPRPGCVLGGTAWDFCNTGRVARDALDLLVIEEAGQFSLANTIAVSVSTSRLLLIGDPQQLPQVSQGAHPVRVDRSALAWLAEGESLLPPELGLVLPRSWRLHPALCTAVSTLSYNGTLTSSEVAAARNLADLAPGVHVVDVDHHGNSVVSGEESAEVLAQVTALLGRAWTDGGTERPLTAADIMVVAAYNAQVQRIRADLDRVGLAQVRVGTVDKFQGAQAAVALISLAASTAADAPRGARFLLSRNRINVAISRAQWAAIIVRSPALVRHVPADDGALAELGAFIDLTHAAHELPAMTGRPLPAEDQPTRTT